MKRALLPLALFALGTLALAEARAVAQGGNSAGPGYPIKVTLGQGFGFIPHSEDLVISPDGTVDYTTTSINWDQNNVGEFRFKVDPSVYQKISALVTPGLLADPVPLVLQMDQGIETISFDRPLAPGQTLHRLARGVGNADKVFDSLAPLLVSLKAEALRHPYATAKLSCVLTPDALSCSVTNEGRAPFKGPNPDSAVFSCFDKEQHLIRVNIRPTGAESSPASRIDLTPGTPVEFKFAPAPKCQNRLVLSGNQGGTTIVSNVIVTDPRSQSQVP
jgi:hypothetical protein